MCVCVCTARVCVGELGARVCVCVCMQIIERLIVTDHVLYLLEGDLEMDPEDWLLALAPDYVFE